MKTDESNIGVWLWVALLAIVNITWISMDLWLRRHGHEYLTTEFQEGVHGRYGVLLGAAVGATIGAFLVHMYVT